eukprot:CAMPEP_0180166590 /NCGR_PEP_ID=MMETSP0986-20121125/31661_1 /TAXON_ID=697907 /ORGANISM="non described non described, Strain CCMP2293" /LENGTH=83 /DNA_ID=CAMNT_0022117797 /DNA_START=100 /DNA_END=351 /DNA_ORIENTATION=-
MQSEIGSPRRQRKRIQRCDTFSGEEEPEGPGEYADSVEDVEPVHVSWNRERVHECQHERLRPFRSEVGDGVEEGHVGPPDPRV